MKAIQDHRLIPVLDAVLPADITVPDAAVGLVLFAHGSGSSRLSPRNRAVTDQLNAAGLATVLADLLMPREAERDAVTAEARFDIDLLATRLTGIADWLLQHPATSGLRLGLFGASTGAAAALRTAADRQTTVRAVVSRGGRPDLANEVLPRVRQPVLLIVGERDEHVLTLNRTTLELLAGPSRLEIVPGATHLFEEPGAMERVAELASNWFRQYLVEP
jgi:putative phosphoribosyl transferase